MPRRQPSRGAVSKRVGHEGELDSCVLEKLARVRGMLRAIAIKKGVWLGSNEIDDLSQDVSLVVLRKISGYTGRANLETWIYRVCELEVLAYRRSQFRQRNLTRCVSSATLSEIIDGRSTGNRGSAWGIEARRLLRRLPGALARVVWLRLADELSFDEVADRVGRPVSTVRSQYSRAIRQLRSIV